MTTNKLPPLREQVKQSLQQYFAQLDGATPAGLYEMVLKEIEHPLLECTIKYTGNKSKAAELLGINRGTLIKKLKAHGIF